MKKDYSGYKTPVQIEMGEWWFFGRIIQEQNHPLLSKYVSFDDNDANLRNTETHSKFASAKKHCKENPCKKPARTPFDYGFGQSPYLKDILK